MLNHSWQGNNLSENISHSKLDTQILKMWSSFSKFFFQELCHLTVPFNNSNTLLNQQFSCFPAINYLTGPLRKQRVSAKGSKGHVHGFSFSKLVGCLRNYDWRQPKTQSLGFELQISHVILGKLMFKIWNFSSKIAFNINTVISWPTAVFLLFIPKVVFPS